MQAATANGVRIYEAPASNQTSSALKRLGRRQRVSQALAGQLRSLTAHVALSAHNKQHGSSLGRTLQQSGSSQGSGPDSAAHAMLHADVQVLPPYPPASYPQLAQQLGSSSAAPADPGLQILGVRSISKQGIAGNGICELGELPSANNTGEHTCLCMRGDHPRCKWQRFFPQSTCLTCSSRDGHDS